MRRSASAPSRRQAEVEPLVEIGLVILDDLQVEAVAILATTRILPLSKAVEMNAVI
jgi:hypothetical protein